MVDLGPLYYKGRPGDIFLVPMPGRGGRAIRVAQWLAGDGRTKYQHAGVVVGQADGFQGTRTVEAYPGGAILGRLDRFVPETIVWLRCPPAYRDTVAAAALSFRGTQYSAAEYTALSLHRFGIPAPHLRKYIESSRRMICSQLADRAAEIGGWHIFEDGRWHGYVTPNDLGKAAALQSPARPYVERARVSR
jgi:hypothetical protein